MFKIFITTGMNSYEFKKEKIKTFLILFTSSILMMFVLKLLFNMYYTDSFFYIGIGSGLIAFVLKTEKFNFLPWRNLLSKDFPLTNKDVLEDIEKRKKNKPSSYRTKELPFYFAIIAIIHILLSLILVFITI